MQYSNSTLKNFPGILKALGHPRRFEIAVLLCLGKGGKMAVNEIQNILHLSQPETSRHLNHLKSTGALLCQKEGLHVYYSINEEHPFMKLLAPYIRQSFSNPEAENNE